MVVVSGEELLLLLLLLLLDNGRRWRRNGGWKLGLGLFLVDEVRLGWDEDGGRVLRIVDGDVFLVLDGLFVMHRLLWGADWRSGRRSDDAGVLLVWGSNDIVHVAILLGKLGGWSWNIADLGAVEGEAWARSDAALELGNSDALAWIHLKDEAENRVELGGDWKDAAEEVGLGHESTEGAVGGVGPLPWVAAAGEVDEDDAEGPDIVGNSIVGGGRTRSGLLAFRRHVKGRTTSKVRGVPLSAGETKVGQLELVTALTDKNVLRLEVAVVDAHGMAVLDGIQELKEHLSSQSVVSNISSLLGDV